MGPPGRAGFRGGTAREGRRSTWRRGAGPCVIWRSMALRVRLTEVQCEADSLAAAQAAGLATPEGGLRGWAALLNPAPPSLCDGLGRAGLQVLRGSRGALAIGSLPLLGRAGQGLEGSLADAEGRALAGELRLRATAVEAGCAVPGLGAPGGGRPRWTLPRSRLPEGRTLVMGIVNVTPDSFSDGGRFFDPGRAIEHGLALAREGADLLDVGGESTNPFVSQPVDVAEEILGHVRKRIDDYRDGKEGALVTRGPRPKGGLSAVAELFS